MIDPGDDLMTNFDHTIVEGAEEFLKTDPYNWGRHAAWNFNGILTYENGQFQEKVYQYYSLEDTITADSLQELMEKVNVEYGYE